MSNVFFISDLHFGHRRIVEFGRRTGTVYRSGDDYIENMHNIITNWNKTVTKNDVVWVLGDIAFSREGFEALRELNGNLKMVRGNHDDRFTTYQWLSLFSTVESMVKYKGYWLTHCPIHPCELWGKKNIHGHVHFNGVRSDNGNLDDRYINVCCEAINETPISFDDIHSGRYAEIRRC